MRGNTDRVNTCTTAQFDGMTAIMNPKESWVAKWKRVGMSIKQLLQFQVFFLILIYLQMYQ
jgi:transcription elongation factor SPT4